MASVGAVLGCYSMGWSWILLGVVRPSPMDVAFRPSFEIYHEGKHISKGHELGIIKLCSFHRINPVLGSDGGCICKSSSFAETDFIQLKLSYNKTFFLIKCSFILFCVSCGHPDIMTKGSFEPSSSIDPKLSLILI